MTENYTEDEERRMDIIGQNGNDGAAYDHIGPYTEKERQRAEIAEQTEEFLHKGGKVTTVNDGASGIDPKKPKYNVSK